MTRKKQQQSLVALGATLHDLKRRRDAINDQIADAEQAIIKRTGFALDEGQKTFKDSDGAGAIEVVIKQPVSRTVLPDVWDEVKGDLPATYRRTLVVNKPTLAMKEVNALRKAGESDPKKAEVYRQLAQAVQSKPGKVNVTIKTIALAPSTEASA